jgi:hypothetical protein
MSVPEHGVTLDEVSEDNWFFRLLRYPRWTSTVERRVPSWLTD